jgi:hypothetical protein
MGAPLGLTQNANPPGSRLANGQIGRAGYGLGCRSPRGTCQPPATDCRSMSKSGWWLSSYQCICLAGYMPIGVHARLEATYTVVIQSSDVNHREDHTGLQALPLSSPYLAVWMAGATPLGSRIA